MVADHHRPGPQRRPGTAGNADTGGDLINNSDPTGLFSLSDALDAGESIFSTAGIMAGPWGTTAAVVGSCAVGGFLGYNNADLSGR